MLVRKPDSLAGVHPACISRVCLVILFAFVLSGCRSTSPFDRAPQSPGDHVWLSEVVLAVPLSAPGPAESSRTGVIARSAEEPDHDPRSSPIPAGWQPRSNGRPLRVAAFSGGGVYGAFGIGVLTGMAGAGDDLSDSTVFLGVSAGAIQAIEAFGGKNGDGFASLKAIFVDSPTEALLVPTSFAGKLGLEAGTYRVQEVQELARDRVAHLFDSMAAAHREGRRCFIATTDFETGDMCIWNIGRIAELGAVGGRPDSRGLSRDRAIALIGDVVAASAAAPYYFSPLPLPSISRKNELEIHEHCDGGVSQNVVGDPRLWESLTNEPEPGSVVIVRNGPRLLRQGSINWSGLEHVGRASSIWIAHGEERGIDQLTQTALQHGWKVFECFLPETSAANEGGSSFDFSLAWRQKLFCAGCRVGRTLGTEARLFGSKKSLTNP